MTIESAANLRRLVRSGLVIALGMLSLSGAATAQKELVSTGSIIPLQLNVSGPCQVYKFINAPNGDTVLLDVCGGGVGLPERRAGGGIRSHQSGNTRREPKLRDRHR